MICNSNLTININLKEQFQSSFWARHKNKRYNIYR